MILQIEFRNGIPGFEEYKKFTLNDIENNQDFKSLVSIDDEYIGFVCISPFIIDKEYEIDINDEIIDILSISKPEDVLVLVLVRLGKYIKDSTVNLKAPILINTKNNQAIQYIIQSDKYLTREPIAKGL